VNRALAAFAALAMVIAPASRAYAEDAGVAAPAASGLASAPDEGEADPAALFRSATDALAGDRPADAIARFEALGDRGVVDPVLSYDRGLAYAARVRAGAGHPGDLGRAAHAFEEARELSSDAALVADATRALAAVRAEIARRRARTGDPIEIDSGVSLGRSIVQLLPENAWAILAALSSLAMCVGIVVRARASERRAKVAGTTTASVAFGVLLVTALLVHSARDARLHLREAVVIAEGTRLLDDRRIAIADVGALPEGARVQLQEEGTDFARVVVGRTTGVLPSSAILPLAKR